MPLIVKPPANVACKPRVTDAIAELVDFPATVYELASIEPGYDHFGQSLIGVLSGETDEHRDAAFCEGGRRHGEEQCMEKASNPELDPANLYWPRMVMQRSEGPEHGKAVMCRTRDYKYTHRLYESDELYDLRGGPRRGTQPDRRAVAGGCPRAVPGADPEMVHGDGRRRPARLRRAGIPAGVTIARAGSGSSLRSGPASRGRNASLS